MRERNRSSREHIGYFFVGLEQGFEKFVSGDEGMAEAALQDHGVNGELRGGDGVGDADGAEELEFGGKGFVGLGLKNERPSGDEGGDVGVGESKTSEEIEHCVWVVARFQAQLLRRGDGILER